LIHRLIREPLLHFLILGMCVFVGYHLFANPNRPVQGKIAVTQAKIDNLIDNFARSWNRPPTQDELNGLIRDYVREEASVREAIALGLDRDDTVIRRRLRQKMDFMIEDVAAQTEPSEKDLALFLRSHPEKFRTEGTTSFQHVYFNPSAHKQIDQEIRQALEQLKNGRDFESYGDPILIDRVFKDASSDEIKGQFGEKFLGELDQVPIGQWSGPIESGLGLHLVFITERKEGKEPDLNQIHDQVKREWANAKRVEMNERAYRDLLARYSVVIEQPAESKKEIAQVRR
jgi:hypothetical protein